MSKEEKGNDTPKNIERIFSSDEFELRAVDPNWTEDEMLDQEGIFYLKDVAHKLEIPSNEFKKEALSMLARKEDAWKIMGIRKAWTHWQVRMKVFAPFFRNNWLPKIQSVNPDWDGNTLLQQTGTFYLVDVCEKIPFTTHQIRYQARRHPSPRETFGVWKDDQYNSYLVDMEVFSKWMKNIWQTGSMT